MSLRNLLLSALFLMALPVIAQSAKTEVTPLQRVQEFYSWYVPISIKGQKEPPFIIALKKKGSFFSTELAQALKADAAAQAKVEGEIVGLDWDPFLNSQDPASLYETGKVTTKGDRTLVEVHSVRSGKKTSPPDIIVELSLIDGKWLFTNFRAADGTDLLSALKTLRDSRHK